MRRGDGKADLLQQGRPLFPQATIRRVGVDLLGQYGDGVVPEPRLSIQERSLWLASIVQANGECRGKLNPLNRTAGDNVARALAGIGHGGDGPLILHLGFEGVIELQGMNAWLGNRHLQFHQWLDRMLVIRSTTVSNPAAASPEDRINRRFAAVRPNTRWIADFTDGSPAQRFVYRTFLIDVVAWYIVGWTVSRSARTDFVRDALEQALRACPPFGRSGLLPHGDHGGQSGSIRYPERLAKVGIEPSVGSVGDSYENA